LCSCLGCCAGGAIYAKPLEWVADVCFQSFAAISNPGALEVRICGAALRVLGNGAKARVLACESPAVEGESSC
jgi:hypothetical protein